MGGGFLSKQYIVTKVIDFCYGHRLLNYAGKCKNLHGHNGKLEIDITADKLDARGIAQDFSEIKKTVKSWIDAELDHKMLLNEKDPMVPFLREKGESIFLFQDNPTAENIAKLIFEETKKMGFAVTEVRLWETADSYATYRES